MGKVNKNKEEKKKKFLDGKQIASIFMLLIMVLSLIGMGVLMSGNFSPQGGQELPDELDLQQVTGEDGNEYWITIRNGEEFVFDDINRLEARSDAQEIAEELSGKDSMNLYQETGFEFNEPLLLIERALNGVGIANSQTNEKNCQNEDTLVFTTDASDVSEECYVFEATDGAEASEFAQAITYHIVS